MGTMASISIDLTKLDRSKIIKGRNGAEYYNLNISINDKVDNYGNNISVTEPQTKEEREAKANRIFYGNGKVFWTDGNIQVAKKNTSNNDEAPF